MDGERVFWYYPPLNRHGLALRDMDDNQRKLAYAVMESGLTERAYKQAAQIIDLETTLGKVEKDAGIISFRRDPELYYFTVFGDPRDSENPWAWRVEGTPCLAALQHLGRQGHLDHAVLLWLEPSGSSERTGQGQAHPRRQGGHCAGAGERA